MASDDLPAGDSTDDSNAPRLSRRRALAAGAGLVGGLAAMGSVSASSHDALVSEDGGSFVAENGGTVVYSGGDLIDAIQAAVDSLTSGRTSKEKVRVDASGDTGSASSRKAVDLPSYTILDVPGTINVNDSGEPWIIPVRADGVQSIEIPRLNVTGNPRYGIRISHSSDVIIGDVNMELSAGLGVRIDGRNGTRTTDVTLNNAYVTGSSTHAVETYGVDNIDIGTVETVDTGGCGLLLNDTSDATVDYVNATRADQGGGYAGFRCANDAGPNITVNRVDAVDCGRGIFTVSGSSDIEIYDVYLDGNGGNLIQDTRDTLVDGGTITNTGGSGIRIDSRSSDTHPYTRNITVRNLTIENNGNWGVNETGPDTESNTITGNSFCDNASGAVSTYASNTTVSNNTYNCNSGGGGPISTGTYRVSNVNSGKLLEVAGAGTSDGDTVQQYGDTGCSCQQWYVEDTGNGVYRFENVNSGKVMEISGAGTSDGDNVQQWSDNSGSHQRWTLESASTGYKIVNQNSGKLADVDGASTADGANVLQWTDNGGANQHWTFESV